MALRRVRMFCVRKKVSGCAVAYFLEHPLEEATVTIGPLRAAWELAPLPRGCKVPAKRTKCKVQIRRAGVQDFQWHELDGNRCTHVGDRLLEATTVAATFLCIVVEPLRILQKWFVKRASTLRRAVAQNRGLRLRPSPFLHQHYVMWCGRLPASHFARFSK